MGLIATGSSPPLPAFAVPDKRGWLLIPAPRRLLKPAPDLVWAVRMLSIQRPSLEDPMARPHGGEPVPVEAADPGGDGLVVPSSDLVGGSRVTGPIRNGQERSGALDLRGGGAGRAAQAGQLLALIRRERAKGIFPVARHGTPRDTRIVSPLYQTSCQVTH